MYRAFEESKLRCRECIVGGVYDRVVLSDGNKNNPTVLVVGESPGADEIEVGKPFVGKAGKLLRSTLNQFGFNKNNSLITNTIPCRPENNKFPKDDNLVNACIQKWLRREIEITKPKYILLIGATPTKYLLGLTGITQLRGEWYDFNDFGIKISCMPTYHSSYVLRKQYMEEGKKIKQCFINDIKVIAEKAGFKPISV